MKTMKLFMTFIMAIALVSVVSCKKDSLEEAVLPQNTATENTTNSAGGTNGTNGTNGSNGVDGTNGTNGTNGQDGEDGEDGEDGQDGVDGEDGADGQDGTDGVDGQDGADGTDGADGATGPQGPAGADGADGVQGPKGDTGTANVIYSDWFYPKWNLENDPKYKRMEVFNTKFASNREDGVILFYWGTNNGSTYPLPWNSFNSTTGALRVSRGINVRGNSGKVWITIRKIGSDFQPKEYLGKVGNITHNKIRYIIIPGGVKVGPSILTNTTSKGLTESDLKKMSYEEVCAALNIPE